MFQPHGYGPLKVMKDALIAGFARDLAVDDLLIMPDPAYFGGSVSREVGSADIVAGVSAAGRHAVHIPDRADRKSTRLNSSSLMRISYAVFCLQKKNTTQHNSTCISKT